MRKMRVQPAREELLYVRLRHSSRVDLQYDYCCDTIEYQIGKDHSAKILFKQKEMYD